MNNKLLNDIAFDIVKEKAMEDHIKEGTLTYNLKQS